MRLVSLRMLETAKASSCWFVMMDRAFPKLVACLRFRGPRIRKDRQLSLKLWLDSQILFTLGHDRPRTVARGVDGRLVGCLWMWRYAGAKRVLGIELGILGRRANATAKVFNSSQWQSDRRFYMFELSLPVYLNVKGLDGDLGAGAFETWGGFHKAWTEMKGQWKRNWEAWGSSCEARAVSRTIAF